MMSDQALELRRQLENMRDPREAKTISIVSGKGGVGKSNFALNFSLTLIKNQKKVLLIDLDVGMGNINILLGLHADKTIIDMLHEFLPIHSIIEKGPSGLDFISGGSGARDLFTLNDESKNHFYEQYSKLVSEYDFIIFDLGAGATRDSIFFILASEECIVITTPEPTSITDSYGMIKHIINKQPIMPIYLVMNRCYSDKSGEQSLINFKQVVTKFLTIEIKVLGMIPDDKTVNKAVMRQQPYVLLNEKAPVSKAVSNICDNYLNDKQGSRMQKSTFIQKLAKFIKER